MDDLNGLDWSSSLNKPASTAPRGAGNYYPALRPTPSPQNSGRSTPLSQVSGSFKSTPFPPPKSSTPDSFANLVSFGSTKQTTLTLQEQQERLHEERRLKELEGKKEQKASFVNAKLWDGLELYRPSQPAGVHLPVPYGTTAATFSAMNRLPGSVAGARDTSQSGGQIDDLFNSFSMDSPPHSSTPFVPNPEPKNTVSTAAFGDGASSQGRASELKTTSKYMTALGDDDDPFGLANLKPATSGAVAQAAPDQDDILGDLAKPVEEIRRTIPPLEVSSKVHVAAQESDDQWDKAVTELVDMGFTAEQSRRALIATSLDVQAAVSWILDEVHQQSKQKKQSHSNGAVASKSNRGSSQGRLKASGMLEDGLSSRSSSLSARNPSPVGDVDLVRTAAAMGSNLFSTANSLWKTSQKKVQKAVSEFNQEPDRRQPRWMQEVVETHKATTTSMNVRRGEPASTTPRVTDEALMLERGGRPNPERTQISEPRLDRMGVTPSQGLTSAGVRSSPVLEPPRAVPRWQSEAAQPSSIRQISRQATEEQIIHAYTSPARRKRSAQDHTKLPVPVESSSSRPSESSKEAMVFSHPQFGPTIKAGSIPSRVHAPRRQIPAVSPAALATSTHHRLTGTSYFKSGDYAAANASYSSSLAALPPSHPISMVLLCNRALTSLRTGEPKSAVADADSVIELIGPSHGENERVDLGAEGQRSMKELWGKALMRKAEALEQMEKWKEAADAWRLCVESNFGAGVAIQGRTRCEKALAPKLIAKGVPQRPQSKGVASSSIQKLQGATSQRSEAVSRLRQANRDADKADEERFALTDVVNERISQWRDGKRDNLRALIGSLDTVLWEGSGWKKVGMNELLQKNKVKVHYMKAIGKCHPDKLPQDASTEVRLIAALVFSTLNESWDKFKEQNNL